MISKSSIFRISILVAGLTVSLLPAGLGGELSHGTVSISGNSAQEGCADDEPEKSGTSKTGCGEDMDWQADDYKVVELHQLFENLAGDKPLFPRLRDQDAGDLKYSAGAELRYRYMNEQNRLRPGGPGHSAYDLWRFTPFVQANYNDFVGGYVQAIDASMFGLNAPYTATPIDVNRTDILQMYAELNLGDVGDGKLKYRYGRQFLQYGSQRLLSPLAWANTFRNFEGHKLVYTSTDWDIDGFVMQSVNGASGNINRPYSFDHADQSRTISGFYSTYKGVENNTYDLYWLYFDEQQSSAALMDGQRHTIGTRIAGKQPIKEGKKLVGTWNWDVEGAYQFGQDNFGSAAYRDVQAAMIAALVGYTIEDMTWKPSIGGIFYYGTGDKDPTTGKINTFDVLYPLGHAYWGQIDNLSGQNLVDYGVQAGVKPHEKLNLTSQWHYFDQAQASTVIYNVVGGALPGSGGYNLGNELDIVGTYTYSKAFNLQAGYFWFFYGGAINKGPLARSDAEQFYLQATYSF
ncbi:MAG: alginate export family protein [Planctomycetaceae bacterium]|nr:alginate export family protein [Planctomycetaceae bacterium]